MHVNFSSARLRLLPRRQQTTNARRRRCRHFVPLHTIVRFDTVVVAVDFLDGILVQFVEDSIELDVTDLQKTFIMLLQSCTICAHISARKRTNDVLAKMRVHKTGTAQLRIELQHV